MHKVIKYFIYLLLIAIIISIGIIIPQYFNLAEVETINIIDIATLVTTIFLAVYIPEVVEKRQKITHEKKSLIVERIDQLLDIYRKINMLIQQSQTNQINDLEITHFLDICQHRLDTIDILLRHADLKVSFKDDIQRLIKLCEEHQQLLYKEPSNTDKGYIYSATIRKQEELLYNKIDTACCLLIFKLSDIY
ncbi:hypothetical protein [Entomomonas asaccharolytica]|uniref:Uncharacterized protein n=1 Tax=Entomomonas asaccharolytica TaxID=2785331 RepID=A0A974NGJ7_9GAMM|nr:hypothetical protein [Entomomonas asaccharolytica]QQP86112.1 hypothetical protein JHT90_02340 [Entomomonas asaccharolytica]